MGITVSKFCRDKSECHPNAHCVINSEYKQYACECLNGFEGDGVHDCHPVAECNPRQPGVCPEHSQCEYNENVRAFKCKCSEGYIGDGFNCVKSGGETCQQNPSLCHSEAQCVYNQGLQRHICVCKPGWIGDGYSSCQMTRFGTERFSNIFKVNVLEVEKCAQCSTNARCVLKQDGEHDCECLPGYEGNGQVCTPAVSCLNDNSMCDKNARCVLTEKNNYVCNCNYGYVGDGRVCTPDKDSDETLFVTRGISIFKRELDPEIAGKQLIIRPGQALVGLGYDCKEKRIYWSDVKGPVNSAMLNGSNVRKVLTLSSPEGIAVDSASRNFYYVVTKTDSPEIGVASLDGRYRKTLAKEGFTQPRYLALDTRNKYLYYSDWYRPHPIIGRMRLDGTGHEVFVDTDLALPHGLALVKDRDELCWVDAELHSLSCIGLHNRVRRLVYKPLEYPFGLTVHNSRQFYWTDWKDNKIHTVSIDGSGYNSFPLTHGVSRVTKPFGLIIVNPSICQEDYSPCAENNGGCPYLCLPSTDGPLCVDPDNLESPGGH
uniref:EGF-like domain-containing protein n=1 Tax=Syphacia muris TaxID=451379 RepID=A0A0N5AHZ3_9BILA